MRASTTFLAIILLALTGCVHVMSDETGTLAVPPVTFEEIREKPQFHLGKIVMLGGVVDSVVNATEGGQIEVLQYPLDSDGFPELSGGSAGRFLVTSPTHFDPQTYPKGALITVLGELKAERTVQSAWGSNRLPVVSIRKAHVWEEDKEKDRPFLIPGTNLVDPYYTGHDVPLPKRPGGSKTYIW